ncbi:MAG: methylmalonyl-CoA mutase [Deltaproteobacteria bacterium]|nr:methylmalonyl-CoA mutase [Deltaproteobacteria bacterium]MBW1932615.1 methylmalonyl-CoA mutase [Deltaproteobacteria bacterium]RLB35136.1 MAG: methylmalonyl-CoA mutase [Deltaproteobacteria bacterium]
MKEDVKKIRETYQEKARTTSTLSGIPINELYRPEDIKDIQYERDIADSGHYPFTRGIYPNMFRGRYWTRREVCGFGTPAHTNNRLLQQIKDGVGGLNVIVDMPTRFGVDVQHPLAEGEVGAAGVPLTSLKDMEDLTRGIPISDVSFSLISSSCVAPIVLSQYVIIAQRQGLDISNLRGTIQNDTLSTRFCGMGEATPADLAIKISADVIEFCTRYMPRWNPINVNLYDLRETGISAPQELGFGFANAIAYIEEVLERGLKIDEFAPRFAFYCSAHIDFFEEIAKLRAARRMWAKIMRKRFKAKNPNSWKFRFGIHTAGCSLMAQQPLNNIVRVAFEAMSAVLAGVQSLHCCSYDEPIALPNEITQKIALRTQQIIAYETGAAATADPLAGSYYLESLTNKIEEEASKILKEIDGMGGAMQAIKKGWIDAEIEKEALRFQEAIEKKERIIVGVNEFVEPEEEATIAERHKYSSQAEKEHIDNVKRLRIERNTERVKESINNLRNEAAKGRNHNLIPSIIEAVKAYATTDEIIGTIRECLGYSYDPFEIEKSPF